MKCKELIFNGNTYTLPSQIESILITKQHEWLLKAEYDYAIIELVKNNVIWHMGTWHKGHWYGDLWLDGIWHTGYWHKGEWKNGTWHNGTWLDGIWHTGEWLQGKWIKGLKKD